MRSLLGFASLGAGLALGAYVYMPSALPRLEYSRHSPAADIVVPKPAPAVRPTAAVADAKAGASNATRTFAPSSPLFSPSSTAIAANEPGVVRPAGEPVIAATPSGIKVSEQSRNMRPADEDSRRELVRNIQKELKRVGCYGGETHGAWTAASQRAMTAFTERVNATLPVKEPDGILLTLVRGAKPGVCGTVCPTGQALDSDERCVPKGVLAAQERKTKVADKTQPTKAPEPMQVGQGWTTTTLAQKPDTVAAPAPALAKRPAELPGLMTVGGPKAEGNPTDTATATGIASTPSPGDTKTALPEDAIGKEAERIVPAPKKVKRETSLPAPRPNVTAHREHSRNGTRSVQEIFLHPLSR